MKRLVPIALLGLLLYHTFGLAVAVLCFDKQFENVSTAYDTAIPEVMAVAVPSLPYTDSWENENGTPGLVKKNGEFYNVIHQKIENDTLYVTLQPNVSARERFVELAENMNHLSDQKQKSESTSDRAVKLLNELLKCYLPFSPKSILHPDIYITNLSIDFPYCAGSATAPLLSTIVPPPDRA
ncbi:MAG: hypothetical protein ABIN80_30070 [Dyadobacter sp.]|uniref:hypothetical protein n=1 Tax=Dyadobacter sp. TaxID=1914288 RepID=UPI0032656E82